MIERQKSHKPGTFPICRDCQKEPRHFVCGGGMYASGMSSEKHFLECRCGNRTMKYADFAIASRDWRDLFGVSVPAQVSPIKRCAAK